MRQRRVLSGEDLAATRAAGLDDGSIIEIVANVPINVLTNCPNNVARTDVDFPPVSVDLEDTRGVSLTTCHA